ncbi:hypothetical protein [Alkalicoccobacillus porphyridii]|uniref:Uncharacterized protein n=1 Tax=Alkalicoccobacillus porphyridii TaxID=2597270 RepID=A0A553ZZ48_9BACI|nr:hypothetical protein [Alkalicoccobacillus porphyridii]TSB46717.1 hypothetical protein FN960_10205 [Alkalicoccobacillus porphyridii]
MNPIRTEHFIWSEERQLSRVHPLSANKRSSSMNIDGQLKFESNRQAMLSHEKDLVVPKTRLGIWTDKGTSWFSTSEWDLFPGYYQKDSLLVSHAYHRKMHLLVTAFDRPDQSNLGFIRMLTLKNQSDRELSFKLLLHQQSLLPQADEHVTFFVPEERALIHHQQYISTLVAARFSEDVAVRYEAGSFERNWDDTLGTIQFSPLASGSSESMIVIDVKMESGQELKGAMWVVSHDSLTGLEKAHLAIQQELIM